MVPILAVFELFFKIDLIYNFVLISPTVCINSSFHVFENITLSKENEEFYLVKDYLSIILNFITLRILRSHLCNGYISHMTYLKSSYVEKNCKSYHHLLKCQNSFQHFGILTNSVFFQSSRIQLSRASKIRDNCIKIPITTMFLKTSVCTTYFAV